MQPRRLRIPFPIVLGAAVAALVLAGCRGSGPTPARSTGPSSVPTPAVSPSPGTATPPATTGTPWGVIWDAVPPGFPAPPAGARPVEVDEPVSTAWSMDRAAGPVAGVADFWVGALRAVGWTIEGLSTSPEDGGSVADAVRGAPECRAQVTVTPRGTEILVTVRYAAACPWQ